MRKLTNMRFFQVLVYSSEPEADMQKIDEYYKEFSSILFHESENTTNLIGFLNELCFARVELKPLIENMDEIDQHLPKFKYFKKVLDLLDFQITFTEKRFKYDNNSNRTSQYQDTTEIKTQNIPENSAQINKTNNSKNYDLSWTGLNVELVELGYALFASGSINDGDVQINQIMEFLSDSFDFDVKECYHAYGDIRGRGEDKTIYLNKLIKKLILKMERDDNKKRKRS